MPSHFRMALAGEVWAVADTEAQPDKPLKDIARVRELRSVLYSPLMSNGKSIGVIVVSRRNPVPFSAHHVRAALNLRRPGRHRHPECAAVQRGAGENGGFAGFADSSRRQRRTCCKSSAARLSTCNPFSMPSPSGQLRLCGADRAFIYRFTGEMLHMVTAHNTPPAFKELDGAASNTAGPP